VNIRVLQHHSRVLLLVDGALVADIPAGKAKEVGGALRVVGARAEEWEQAERLIQDQALMIRTGAPIGLTDNVAINKAALTEAQWGNLRKYIPNPGGIKSQAVFGRARIFGGKLNGKPS